MCEQIPVWVEIHVDDEILSAEPHRAAEAHDLILTIADATEGAGAHLCFRVREVLAETTRDRGLLPELVERGHEVGVHAHGRRLRDAVDAVRAAGVFPEVAVPGLVQAGPGGRRMLLQQAAGLGIGVVTDHGAEPAWAYDGLAMREEEGLLVMAPTVRPFDWGLMDTTGRRFGFSDRCVVRLRHLEAAAAGHGAAWFGFALHEHDLCVPGSLVPRDDALAALASYLDARVVSALTVAHERLATPTLLPPSDRRIRAARAVHKLRSGLGRGFRRGRDLQRMRKRLARPVAGGHVHNLAVDGRAIVAQHHRADRPRAVVVLSHAGFEGGRRLGLQPFGLSVEQLLGRGLDVWLYDRSGTGDSPAGPRGYLTPGNPEHRRDWEVVLDEARVKGLPLVALTWSGGIVPVLAAATRGHRPDALVDGEGPVDRFSLLPPPGFRGSEGSELRDRDPWDDQAWYDVEAMQMLQHLRAPYARLQGTPDHVHGEMTLHARRIAERAVELGLPTRSLTVQGAPLHERPGEMIGAVSWVLDRRRLEKERIADRGR